MEKTMRKNRKIVLLHSTMKRVFVFVVLCLFAKMLHSQIYVSCTHRDYYVYNEATDDFDFLKGYDENSLFKINKDFTMFDHTTPTISSSYYVSDSEYDEDMNILTMNVVSDVGNKYRYYFDFRNELVKILVDKDGEVYLWAFTIKKYWFEE